MKIELTRYCPVCKHTTKHEHDSKANTFVCLRCVKRAQS